MKRFDPSAVIASPLSAAAAWVVLLLCWIDEGLAFLASSAIVLSDSAHIDKSHFFDPVAAAVHDTLWPRIGAGSFVIAWIAVTVADRIVRRSVLPRRRAQLIIVVT